MELDLLAEMRNALERPRCSTAAPLREPRNPWRGGVRPGTSRPALSRRLSMRARASWPLFAGIRTQRTGNSWIIGGRPGPEVRDESIGENTNRHEKE